MPPTHADRPHRVGLGMVAGAAMSSLVLQAALVSTWIRYYVSEDQALLWAAARSWGRGEPRQPHFWGQTYGTTIEAIPAELLRRLGLTLATGLPLTIAFLNIAGWVTMAWAARRRTSLTLAVVALAVPALLSTDYLVLTVAYNSAAGRFASAVAAACVLSSSSSRWRPYAAFGLGAISLLLDNSTILVVAPVCIYAARQVLADGLGWRPRLTRLGITFLPGILWQGLITWWYDAHPRDSLHPAPRFDPTIERLRHHLGDISRFLSTYSADIAPGPLVPLLVIGGLLALSLRSRQWYRVAGISALVALALIILAVPRSADWLPTTYYPAARVLLPLPMAIWFLSAIEPIDLRLAATQRISSTRWAAIAAAAVICLTGVRLLNWRADTVPLRDSTVEYPNYPVTNVRHLAARCAEVAEIGATTDARFVAFDLRTDAYACEALVPALHTVYPPYERRSWVLDEFFAPATRSFIVESPAPPVCGRLVECQNLGSGLTYVTVGDGVTVREAWLSLGYSLRTGY